MGLTREDYRRASEHGVSAQLLCRRIRFGWELERAITQAPQPVAPPDPEMVAWREQAKANGIKRTVFMDRIRAGWRPERAATESVRRWEKMYP
jgi:hypothetical protein